MCVLCHSWALLSASHLWLLKKQILSTKDLADYLKIACIYLPITMQFVMMSSYMAGFGYFNENASDCNAYKFYAYVYVH